ncbi:MAG: diaminopimelate decarboxylase [Candidatus Margulisiibacteriota bacterium]
MNRIRPITSKKMPNDILVGGCSLSALAQTYGTPLYVLDESTIRSNCQLFTRILTEHYPHFTVAYASKAGLNIGISNIIADEGLGADVVSGGELFTVLKSNVDRNKIYFHGNNKSKEELTLAIEHQVRLVVDNPFELALIEHVATELNTQALIMFRIKPGIEAHTHEYIKTGHIDSKFGLTFPEILPLINKVIHSKWGSFIGIHAHIGSQIFDIQPYYDLVSILVSFMEEIKTDTGHEILELNCGGGFGIQYTDNENAPDISEIVLQMATELKLLCQEKNLSRPKLVFEPGRSIIANAGVTLYSVGATKHVDGGSHYLFVDGGMADNPRPMMYQSQYTFDILDPKSPNRENYKIAGKFCESGDILADNVSLPIANANDIIVVYGTGAYNYSMASNYNRFCKPAMVLVNNAKHRLIVKRETYQDIIQHDIL